MTKFRCNYCSSNSDFLWLDNKITVEGFRQFQCLKCCAVGTKNMAESLDTQEPVIRCTKCSAWKFVDKPCHTCALIGAYDANL